MNTVAFHQNYIFNEYHHLQFSFFRYSCWKFPQLYGPKFMKIITVIQVFCINHVVKGYTEFYLRLFSSLPLYIRHSLQFNDIPPLMSLRSYKSSCSQYGKLCDIANNKMPLFSVLFKYWLKDMKFLPNHSILSAYSRQKTYVNTAVYVNVVFLRYSFSKHTWWSNFLSHYTFMDLVKPP